MQRPYLTSGVYIVSQQQGIGSNLGIAYAPHTSTVQAAMTLPHQTRLQTYAPQASTIQTAMTLPHQTSLQMSAPQASTVHPAMQLSCQTTGAYIVNQVPAVSPAHQPSRTQEVICNLCMACLSTLCKKKTSV
ncbi:uncharacterized protein [Dendropsophus ebraccatus]